MIKNIFFASTINLAILLSVYGYLYNDLIANHETLVITVFIFSLNIQVLIVSVLKYNIILLNGISNIILEIFTQVIALILIFTIFINKTNVIFTREYLIHNIFLALFAFSLISIPIITYYAWIKTRNKLRVE